jgi:release factor glutamine methyltransferase
MKNSFDLKARRAKDLLQWSIEELRGRNVETSRLDAEVLLAHALKRDRLQLYLTLEEEVDEESELYYRTLIRKRSDFTPVSYLTGHKEFMSLDFVVNESVLIPRPETEVLVETVCRLGKAGSYVLELGTGSGAIAVSLANCNPDWRVLATDVSMEALLIAKENARRYELIDRVSFLQADLLSALSSHGEFDWVVSNPPYIPVRNLASLPIGIRKYEPMLALDGGADGLDVIRRIIEGAHTVLKPGGRLAIEIGYGQSEDVQKIADRTGRYSDCSIVEDYSGIPRVLHCRRRG